MATPSLLTTYSVELTCKLGKSGNENVVKGGKICSTDLTTLNPTAICADTKSLLKQSGLDMDKGEVLCAAGQAISNSNIVQSCYGANLSEALITTILAKFAGSISKTDSLVVGNNIVHQWNYFCSPTAP